MGICLGHSDEKVFLNIIQQMLKEMEENLEFSSQTLCSMKLAYQNLTEEERERSLHMVYEVFRENYEVAIYLFGVILQETRDKKAFFYVIRLLSSKEYSLWERLNDSYQFRMLLFTDSLLKENEEYFNMKRVYEGFLNEIRQKTGCFYPVIPFQKREKKIVITVSQILNIYHAPTNYLARIFRCLEITGYDVECFVCHFPGTDGYWNWGRRFTYQNIMQETGPFAYTLEDVKIKGYNLELHGSDYIETLHTAVAMIWEKKPEYVLEIGSETILAGLCREFTTTVTMGMTDALPITNAQLIVSWAKAFQKQKEIWGKFLEEEQTVVPMKFMVHKLGAEETRRKYQKKDFGIPEDAFVLIIAGNRLDYEIKDSFETVVFRMLEQDEHFVVAVIGECPALKQRFLKSKWKERFYFLGNQRDFRGAIGMGDLFINPPRQGGGTGGLFAMMEGVPVITLGDCDVAENSGEEFVCGSMEEMPKLVYRYYTDREFSDRQKENCRKEAMARTGIDNEKELWKLHEAVEKYAGRWEEK